MSKLERIFFLLLIVSSFAINLEHSSSIRNSLYEQIKINNDVLVEEAVLKCDEDNTEITAKFFTALDDVHNDVVELQTANKTLDEEVVYLSNQNKELETDMIKLLKQRKKK